MVYAYCSKCYSQSGLECRCPAGANCYNYYEKAYQEWIRDFHKGYVPYNVGQYPCNYCGHRYCECFGKHLAYIQEMEKEHQPVIPPQSLTDRLAKLLQEFKDAGYSIETQPALAHGDRRGHYITVIEPEKKP